MNSLKGHLLVAVPQLPDVNFFRSVVIVMKHDEEGATGLVLNRPTNIGICDVWSEISNVPCDLREPIYLGGPVEGPLMTLHDDATRSEQRVIDGVYLSMQRDHINQLIDLRYQPMRVFSGYSGWGSGQLDRELEAGGWLSLKANSSHVFDQPDDLWKSVCQEIGNDILLPRFDKDRIPSDPSLN